MSVDIRELGAKAPKELLEFAGLELKLRRLRRELIAVLLERDEQWDKIQRKTRSKNPVSAD